MAETDGDLALKYGSAASHPATWVTLWWDDLGVIETVKALEQGLEKSEAAKTCGVYVFEGFHDAHPNGAILYVGDTRRALEARLLERRASKGFFFWEEDGESAVRASMWDIRMRVAAVDKELTDSVEQILIRAHAPAFNKKHVGNALHAKLADIVVMNGGSKGRLLPVIAGAYFVPGCWPR